LKLLTKLSSSGVKGRKTFMPRMGHCSQGYLSAELAGGEDKARLAYVIL
jgi:hypothetical protein